MNPESVVQSEIRDAAGKQGIHLFRNNVGACTDDTGRLIRYGLGNDSAQVQRRLKSSDLIGLVSFRVLSPYHADIGRFIAVECKAEGWKFPASWRGRRPTDADLPELKSAEAQRTLAQWRFISLIRTQGGLAGFAQSVDDFHAIVAGNGALVEQ
jgi:hypothetical protein